MRTLVAVLVGNARRHHCHMCHRLGVLDRIEPILSGDPKGLLVRALVKDDSDEMARAFGR